MKYTPVSFDVNLSSEGAFAASQRLMGTMCRGWHLVPTQMWGKGMGGVGCRSLRAVSGAAIAQRLRLLCAADRASR
jgi:hypothetical protein